MNESERLGQFKSMRFERFYSGEIHDGKTYERQREREREREEGENGGRIKWVKNANAKLV